MNHVEYKLRISNLLSRSYLPMEANINCHLGISSRSNFIFDSNQSCESIINFIFAKYNSIYYHSYFFMDFYYYKISISEQLQYFQFPHSFRQKYTILAKLECLDYMIYFVVNSFRPFCIENKLSLFLRKEFSTNYNDLIRQRYFFYEYEYKNINKKRESIRNLIDQRRQDELRLFFLIFYKGNGININCCDLLRCIFLFL